MQRRVIRTSRPLVDRLGTEGSAVRVGDFLFCAATFPLLAGGTVVSGGLVAQATRIYENAARMLGQAGYSMAEVVRTVDFVDEAALPEYRRTGEVRAAYLGPPGAVTSAATGVVMPQLALPGALLQVEFTACHGARQVLNPGWLRYERLTYCPGVRAGGYVLLSGQLAVNPDTNGLECGGDIAGQARRIYVNIQTTLAAAGLSLENVVRTSEYITPSGLGSYDAASEVRRETFSTPYPALTTVVCGALLRPEALIEIDALAVVR